MASVQEMREERYAISQKMKDPLVRNDTTAAGAAQWKTMDDRAETLRTLIHNAERSDQLSQELAEVRHIDRPNIDPGAVSLSNNPQLRALEMRSTEQYKKDFEVLCRTGRESPAMVEIRAMGAASGADGATLVPQGFEAELEIKLKAFGGMTRVCRTITTSTGNPLPWPNLDDTSNVGEWLTEAAGVGSADPTVSNITLGANLLSSKQVKYSVQLEQDAAFDIVGLFNDAFAVRMGRTSNAAYTLGDGTSTYGTITGIVPALVTAGGRSVLAIGANSNTGNSGDTDLNTIGTDDLVALITKVDPAYRAGAKFVGNQSAWDKLRSLKDKYGRPIWSTSLAAGVPDSILGYPYDWNQDMAGIGAGNISMLFGLFEKYAIRNVLGFTFVRFNELYMANYQKAVQAFMRTDAKLLQPAAFSYLIHPLS